MKVLTKLLFLVGILFLGKGFFQITESHIEQENALVEAKELIKGTTTDKHLIYENTQPVYGEIIGVLTIPAINGELPIIEGTDEDELDKGVGHYKGSSLPNEKGQIVLSGHRDTVFRRLGEVKIGDLLSITIPGGSYNYKVEHTQIVDANDRTIITLQKDEEVLTLTTCYPFSYIGDAPQRYIITATPIRKPK